MVNSKSLTYIYFIGLVSKKQSLVELAFTMLYEKEVLPEEAFINWKDSTNNTSNNKRKVLNQTTAFFEWLATAEEEDDEEDEEEED